MATKTCTQCKQEKSVDLFHPHDKGKLGVRSKCKDCICANRRVKYETNRDQELAWKAAWDEANREHARAYARTYAAAHVEARKQYDALQWKTNPAYKDKYRKWAEANPEKAKIVRANANHARRAQIKDDRITAQEWIDLCSEYGNICLKCGIGDVALTMDHVQPLSKGGRHLISNIQPLCKSCNSSKFTSETDYRKVNV